MVTVIPGSDFLDLYAKRNIVTTSTEGDGYMVRKSSSNGQPDPRSGSDWQKNVIDRFGLAAKIWSNKPGCWQDYFKRSKQTYNFNPGDSEKYSKELTGYQLGISILINSLNFAKGSYFDPKCFCLIPTDPIGQTMHTYSRLQLETTDYAHYVYDEYHKCEEWDGNNLVGNYRFCSASTFGSGHGGIAKLDTQFCFPRHSEGSFWDVNLDEIKDIPCFPPLTLTSTDLAFPITYNLTEYERWVFEGLDPIFNEGDAEPLKRFKVTWVDPAYVNSLCNFGYLQFIISYNSTKIVIDSLYTNNEPLYDVYFGELYLGRMGAGANLGIPQRNEVSAAQYNSMNIPEIPFEDNLKIAPLGRQDYHNKAGKVTDCIIDNVSYDNRPNNSCQHKFQLIEFHTNHDIIFDPTIDSPQLRVGVYHVDPNPDKYFYTSSPYGWLRLYRGKDTIEGENSPINTEFGFIFPGDVEHCARNLYGNGKSNTFQLYLVNGPWSVFNYYTASTLGEPGMPSDDVCPNRPALDSIKISFLEYNKNQTE